MLRDSIDLRKGHKRGQISDFSVDSDSNTFNENLTTMVERVTEEHIKSAKADSEFLKSIIKGPIKNKKIKIGLDFDGVISDCGKLKSYAAKLIYNVNIPPERFKKELVVGTRILTSEQYINLQRQIYENPEIGLKNLYPVDGALEYISKLKEDGYELTVISSRGEGDKLKIAREWMKSKDLNLHIIGVELGTNKTKACRGLDIYIDDDLDKLEPLVGVVPYRFLFSQGYNEHIKVSPAIAKRTKSWKQFYKEVSNLNL